MVRFKTLTINEGNLPMTQALNKISKLSPQKLVALAISATVMIIMLVTVSAPAFGHGRYPNYFAVEKPTSKSICYGGSWQKDMKWSKKWEWKWGHDWGYYGRHKVWVPNWQQLGFSSFDQCVRYTTTEAPDSKSDCRNWYRLGFNNRGECVRYVILNGGGGYSGRSEDS
jgi:hypothetical protein